MAFNPTEHQVKFLEKLAKFEERTDDGKRKIDVEPDFAEKVANEARAPLDEILRARTYALKALKDGVKGHKPEALQKAAIERCRRDIVYFINNFAYIQNPHLTKFGFPVRLPFILFPKQEEYVLWREDLYKRNRSGLVYKCRDMGVSWMNMAVQCWHFMFEMGYQGRVGSLKAEEVDDKDDPDSLFQKLRFILYSTPYWMRHQDLWHPGGKHDNKMKMFNPVTQSTISGQQGENMGRGGRAPQPLYSKVLTPDGWSTIGAIRQGDFVMGSNGKPVRVLKTHPISFQPIYRVSFSDGSSAECAEDHLWQVTDKMNRKTLSRRKNHNTKWQHAITHKVLSAKEMLARGLKKGTEYQFHIPLTKPVEYEEKVFPLDPYVLGALLGDGSVGNLVQASAGFTTADPEIVTLIETRLPEGCCIKSDGTRYGYRLSDEIRYCGGHHRESRMKKAIRDAGIAGMKGENKAIPEMYKRGSVSQRLELLRGLMDTDGWLSRPTKQNFGSISHRLISGVREIVQSLGGTANITVRPAREPRLYPGGSMSASKPFYNMVISLPNGMNPFRLKRKASRYKKKKKYGPIRKIVSIDLCGETEVRCLTVEEGLYLTDEHIVTHNSIYDIDEWAKVDHARMVDTNLSRNTPCRIYTGTPMGRDNDYAEKLTSGRLPVFSFDYWDDPRKSPDWFKNQCEQESEESVQQEILKSLDAFKGGTAIPTAWVNAAVSLYGKIQSGDIAYSPTTTTAGLDVAAGGRNRTVLVIRKGIMLDVVKEWNLDNATYILREAGTACEVEGVETLNYDPIAVGFGIKTAVDVEGSAYSFNIVPVDYRGAASEIPIEGDTKPARERCMNRRAELLMRMRRRFECSYEMMAKGVKHPIENCIAVCGDQKLINQLSIPEMFNQNGKWRLEPKEQMVRRGVESVDYFDASMLTEGNEVLETRVVQKFNRKGLVEKDVPVRSITSSVNSIHYISVYHTRALSVGVVGAVWTGQKLIAYQDWTSHNATAGHVVDVLRALFPPNPKDYIGNKEMFAKGADDLFMEYLSHGITMIENFMFNDLSAVSMLNQMVEQGTLRINHTCKYLVNQLQGFDRAKGVPDKTNMEVAMALLNILNRLEEVGVSIGSIEQTPQQLHYRRRNFNMDGKMLSIIGRR